MMDKDVVKNVVSGVLVIDKPVGLTSHDVVQIVRRGTGIRRAGHTGTLDPRACGVLVVLVGPAVRLSEFVSASDKRYQATIRLGSRTDSYDTETPPSEEMPVNVTEEEFLDLLKGYEGKVEQVPPPYSAVKVDGEKAYEKARKGEEVELEPRIIDVYNLDLLEWVPPEVVIDVYCSSGTYIRSLANDIGNAFGCGAHLSLLCRTRVGRFSLNDAWTLTELQRIDLRSQWPQIAFHPDVAIENSPAIVLDQQNTVPWLHGRIIDLTVSPPAGTVRVYSPEGWFVGIGSVSETADAALVQPKRVVYPPGGQIEGQTLER